MKLLIIMLSILASTASYSSSKGYQVSQEQCTDIDVRDTASAQIKEHYSQPSDQGKNGWCYGYTATDLLSFETGKPLSPTHVSSIYNKSIRSNFFWRAGYSVMRMFSGREVYEGGFPGKASREAIKASPVCAYNSKDDYPRYVEILETLKSSVKNQEMSEEIACEVLEHYLPGLDTTATNFMNDFIKNDLNDSLVTMLKQTCSELVEIPKKTVKTLWPPIVGKKKYPQGLNEILNQGRPLSVSYNVSHVTDKMRGYHASTVIGRRWKDGRCEYNIKNTWGRVCSYKPGIECNEDDGSYWMRDEDFFGMALNFTYLQ